MLNYFFGGLILIIGTFFLMTYFKKNVPAKSIPPGKKAGETEKINKDSWTGLYDYRGFLIKLDEMLTHAQKTNQILSLVILDINDFKYCNIVYGRSSGDVILYKIGEIIKSLIPPNCIAARAGGDDFFLLLPEFDTKKTNELIIKIKTAIEDAFKGQENVLLTAGSACYPSSALTKQELIDSAYGELCRAKEPLPNKLSTYYSVLQWIKRNNDPARPDIFAQFFLMTIDLKDHYTLSHTNLVLRYAVGLGEALFLTPEEIDRIKIGAIFHDAGKIQIPEQVLMKAGPLTENEYHYIRRHPLWSAEILVAVTQDKEAALFVKHYHERFDGKGYPDGIAGENIPLGARIIALADSFAAMITPRPYREALSLSQALIEVKKNAGTQFDPKIVGIFMQIIDNVNEE